MTKSQVLLQLKREIQELMGALSIEEILANRDLIQQFEAVLEALSKVISASVDLQNCWHVLITLFA